MKRLFVVLISLVLLTGAASSVQAISMDALFDGGEIIVDDKRFFDWTLIDVVATDPAFDPDFSLIDVTGLDDDPMNPGIRIESNGQLQVQDDNFLDVFFGFTVEVVDSPYVIKDASLSFGGVLGRETDLGDPGIAIYEDIYDQNLNPLATLVQEFTFPGGGPDVPSADFAPQSLLFVDKNILLFGLEPGDSAELSFIDQRFSQEAVPEPATLILLGTGLAGVAIARRKFRK